MLSVRCAWLPRLRGIQRQRSMVARMAAVCWSRLGPLSASSVAAGELTVGGQAALFLKFGDSIGQRAVVARVGRGLQAEPIAQLRHPRYQA